VNRQGLLLVSLKEKQENGLSKRRWCAGKVEWLVGYERMTYCWILLGGNIFWIACFGFGNMFQVVIFDE